MMRNRYFLVEADPLLEKAQDRRQRRGHAIKTIGNFVETLTGSKNWRPGWNGELDSILALPGVNPPAGWRLVKSKRVGQVDCWRVDRPKSEGRTEASKARFAAAKDAAAAVATLPAMPMNGNMISSDCEVSGWIGLQDTIRWGDKDSDDWGGEYVGYAALIWAGESYAIVLPKGELQGGRAARYVEEFPVPTGCREITEAEWNLIVAQFQVDQERAARTPEVVS